MKRQAYTLNNTKLNKKIKKNMFWKILGSKQ